LMCVSNNFMHGRTCVGKPVRWRKDWIPVKEYIKWYYFSNQESMYWLLHVYQRFKGFFISTYIHVHCMKINTCIKVELI
jgi:hypothetical protein